MLNEQIHSNVKKLMPSLLILFVLSNLMVQAFVTVSPLIATNFNISASTASIQATITTITLGVCSVIYGTLSDYIPVKKLLIFGISVLSFGSILGFVFQGNYGMIVVARAVQTMGQAAISSLYLVIASRYLEGSTKIKYFAYFTACFQLAQAAGVLVGGIITTYISWQLLLLIPLCSIVFIPIVMRYTPVEEQGERKKVDFIGLVLFSGMIVLLTLFVDGLRVPYLIGMFALTLIFLFYISRNQQAFITPQFFKENKRYFRALYMVISIYLVQFAFSFVSTFVVTDGYQEPLSLVSYILLPAYIAAAIIGGIGDKITNKLGRFNTILLGISLITAGLLIAGVFITQGKIILSISGILFFVGFNTLYSPLLDTVTGTLPSNELGRGIGLNDLSINISGSLGVAICGKLIASKAADKINLLSTPQNLRTFQTIFFLLSIVGILAIVFFQFNKNKLKVVQKKDA
ncbi:MFS transporter [Enterococcus sp. MJM16]|uniref:MFS transporter n=2 Tax=Enterococcus TaxID=1350 RepID=A0ABS3HI81_9ENTE|nr:MFS transporter [Enterococcus sp. MJM16]